MFVKELGIKKLTRGSGFYMKTVCFCCSKVISTDAFNPSSDHIITHGICDDCVTKMLWPNNPLLLDFIDSLNAPVVVINSSGNVTCANKTARELLQKELPDIVGFQGGNVFECAFAKLPEGCGKTLHCDGCTIRNTVMDTMMSNKSHLNVPAGLSRGISEMYDDIQLLISTEKVNDVVMLRIDKISEV